MLVKYDFIKVYNPAFRGIMYIETLLKHIIRKDRHMRIMGGPNRPIPNKRGEASLGKIIPQRPTKHMRDYFLSFLSDIISATSAPNATIMLKASAISIGVTP